MTAQHLSESGNNESHSLRFADKKEQAEYRRQMAGILTPSENFTITSRESAHRPAVRIVCGQAGTKWSLVDEATARGMADCPACGREKSLSALVCWECWRKAPTGGAGLKYADGVSFG